MDAPTIGSITFLKGAYLEGPEVFSQSIIPAHRELLIVVNWFTQSQLRHIAAEDVDPKKCLRIRIVVYTRESRHKNGGSPVATIIQWVPELSQDDSSRWCPISPAEELLFQVQWEEEDCALKVRWCTKMGIRDEYGEHPWQDAVVEDEDSEISEHNSNEDGQDTENSTKAPSITNKCIADPLSIEGQQSGAILRIMRQPQILYKVAGGAPTFTSLAVGTDMQVGDCVEVIAQGVHGGSGCTVTNARSGAAVAVPWKTFLPVGTREFCDCSGGECRCVYVDFARNLEFRERGRVDGYRAWDRFSVGGTGSIG